MCFIVRNGEKVKIASEDIVCWKTLYHKTKVRNPWRMCAAPVPNSERKSDLH